MSWLLCRKISNRSKYNQPPLLPLVSHQLQKEDSGGDGTRDACKEEGYLQEFQLQDVLVGLVDQVLLAQRVGVLAQVLVHDAQFHYQPAQKVKPASLK